MTECACQNTRYYRVTSEISNGKARIRCDLCDGKVGLIDADAVREIPDNPNHTVELMLYPHDRPEIYDDNREGDHD